MQRSVFSSLGGVLGLLAVLLLGMSTGMFIAGIATGWFPCQDVFAVLSDMGF